MTNEEFMSIARDLLRSRKAEVGATYWLLDDGSETYCKECMVKQKPDGEPGDDYSYSWDGDSDSVELCCECGALLSYTLTDWGVRQELENFIEYGWDWDNPYSCYEMWEVSNGVYGSEQERLFIKALRKGKNRPNELKRITKPKVAA